MPKLSLMPHGEERLSLGRQSNDGRQYVVRERLYNLLSTLGELPVDELLPPWGGQFAGEPFGSALVMSSPSGYVVLGGRCPPSGTVLEHVLVGPAGLVVVGHTVGWATPAPGMGRAHYGARAATWNVGAARLSPPCSPRSAVRETLRQALALRAWASSAQEVQVPVLAAVCSPPGTGTPALFLDGLWAGPLDHLASWLCARPVLEARQCARLAEALRGALGGH